MSTTTADQKTVTLGGGRAWLIWTLAVVFVVWLFNIQTGWAIVKENVQTDLSLGLDQIGMIAAVYTWVFAIAQLFSGALLDRLGSRKVLVPAIALVGIGTFLFATAQNFPMLLLSQVILAVGACAGFVGAGYVGGVWFGMAKFGFMFGLVQVVAALSSAFGQAGFDFALRHLTWRELMNGFGFFGVALLALGLVFIRNPYPVTHEGQAEGFIGSVFGRIVECFKNPQVVLIAISGAITFGVQLALGVVWMPNLVRAHGVGDSQANLSAASLWMGLAIGSLFINKWTDKVRSRKVPYLITAVVMVLAMAAVTYLNVGAFAAMALALVFGMANAGHMLAFTIAGDNVPVRLIGTASSIVNGAMFIVGGILISLPGNMLKGTQETLADYQKPMGVFIILLVVAVIVGAVVKESFKVHED